MTAKEVMAYQPKPKVRGKKKTHKSPFMDLLDFFARIAVFMDDKLGDKRLMKPGYREHLSRIDPAKTRVDTILHPVLEQALPLITRTDSREFLTMTDGTR